MSGRPLLSICIPTMDRAELLELGLANILSEAEPFGDRVEVVVADNASTDGTPELLARFQGRIVTGRQPERVIFPRNLLYVACDLAHGEYVFFMGDDDLLVRGTVARLMALLEANPDLDYVYLNVGWVSIPQRNHAILHEDCRVPAGYEGSFQLREPTTRVLPKLEDVVGLCLSSPYAMFSTIFCYVLRRRLYLEQRDDLHICDDWDHAVQPLDNMFPHGLLSLKACAGRPIGCIGEPAVLQGSWHQGWAPWSVKTMIHGHTLLFEWLEEATAFDRAALQVLWTELAKYAALMLVQMLNYPERHQGLDILRAHALPRLMQVPVFLETFWEEARKVAEADVEVKRLDQTLAEAEAALGAGPARIALWGLRGRGERWAHLFPARIAQLAVVVDGSAAMHGKRIEFFPEPIQAPDALRGSAFDILVMATRSDITQGLLPGLGTLVPEGTPVVSVLGLSRVGGGRP